MTLRQIRSTRDLKRLDAEQLAALASELRTFLIEGLSHTGGHLASNLGVVELTLALHTVFDSPHDKIIWDVGHQAYVHKILTGRMDKFHTLRKLDGLSSFPKSSESEHDAFDTGHSSTSISAALGLCKARDLTLHKNGQKKQAVIAVIGDGSMTGGLAYEALNNAGRSNTDILVVVNDNQMSIAENVGAISRHLNDIRTAPFYLGAKKDVHLMLDHLPVIGGSVTRLIENAKDAVKFMLVPGVMFEEMGFQYFGPVDGHDITAMTEVLHKVRSIRGPVILHVLTVKGKGYNQAEHAPVDFHGVDSFHVDTGEPVSAKTADSYTDIFSRAVVKQANRNDKIVAVTAAMPDGTGLCAFKKRYPKRFFDVGIAEGHAVTFAAGLAKGGMLPVVAVYSTFLQRAYDQILHDVCLQKLHVIFAIDRAGIVGPDGETHQGVYDLSFLSHMPHMTILAPKNKYELTAMMDFAVHYNGPVAIRYPRSAASRVLKDHNAPIVYGRSETIAHGETVALVSVGAMMDTAAQVFDRLNSAGVSAGLYNTRFVKPIDMELAGRLSQYPYVFVLEDNARGGYVSKLLEAIISMHKGCPYYHPFVFPDTFIEQGTRDELFKRYHMDTDSITTHIMQILDNGAKTP